MDSYLAIAEAVMRIARRPLTSREIVEVAYRHDLVPSRLFGRTQHKTVGARLSEDILARRERSLFYRSEPGRFFLREFLSDPTIPKEFRSPIVARRRQRELRRGAPLTVKRETAIASASAASSAADKLHAIAQTHGFYYIDPALRSRRPDEVYVWSFVMFRRGKEVLTYRHGRYREGRDAFLRRRSIGFFTLVVDKDVELFDEGDHGIVSSGIRAIAFDLDLPHIVFSEEYYRSSTAVTDLVVAEDAHGRSDLLAVVSMDCPAYFEPLTRRLAINDLKWILLDVPINHIEDFDPWSQIVFQRAQGLYPTRDG